MFLGCDARVMSLTCPLNVVLKSHVKSAMEVFYKCKVKAEPSLLTSSAVQVLPNVCSPGSISSNLSSF